MGHIVILGRARERHDNNQPHEVCEVMCWHCGHRWIDAHPVDGAPMKEWTCGAPSGCGRAGGVFKTGADLDAKSTLPPGGKAEVRRVPEPQDEGPDVA